MFGFTVPAGHKIGACCARDSVRFAMSGMLLAPTRDEERAYLVATDARILACLPVPTTGTTRPTLLPPMGSNGHVLDVAVNGQVQATTGAGKSRKTTVHELPAQEGRFPAVRGIFPDMESQYTTLRIDAKLLATLAAALSDSGHVTLYLPAPDVTNTHSKPIAVVGRHEDQPYGIGMIVPLCPDKIGTERSYLRSQVTDLPDTGISFETPAIVKDVAPVVAAMIASE